MASNPPTTPENNHPTMSANQQHEADILRALEISPYELVVLEKHLLSHGWIPNTTNEEAIKEAVFNFRESFLAANRYQFPGPVNRLNFLFDAFLGHEEDFLIDMGVQEMCDIVLNRETAKYNAVRSLIADIAVRESRKRNGRDGFLALAEYVCRTTSSPLQRGHILISS
jgi:hypothetical protein